MKKKCRICGIEFDIDDARRAGDKSCGEDFYNGHHKDGDVCEFCAINDQEMGGEGIIGEVSWFDD